MIIQIKADTAMLILNFISNTSIKRKEKRNHNKINNLDHLNFSFHKKKYNQNLFNLQGKNKLIKIHINQSAKNIFPQKLNKNLTLKKKNLNKKS